MVSSQDDPNTSLARERTDLAYHRNRWAAERTLMAWIRTSISMVTFGFAIDQFFSYLVQQGKPVADKLAYHWFGFALVVAGIILLLVAIIEHLITLGRLKRRELLCHGRFSLPLVGASIILLIGVAAMVLILSPA